MRDSERREYEDTILRLTGEKRQDRLTGLGNYAAFVEYCTNLVSMSVPFSIVLMDVTHLKQANTLLGHFGADVLLANVAGLVRAGAGRREGDRRFVSDAVFRHGGDEFAVVLPRTGPSDAVRARDRIEREVGVTHLPDNTPVTVVGSVAHVPPGGDLHAELNRADGQLEARKAEWKKQKGIRPRVGREV